MSIHGVEGMCEWSLLIRDLSELPDSSLKWLYAGPLFSFEEGTEHLFM